MPQNPSSTTKQFSARAKTTIFKTLILILLRIRLMTPWIKLLEILRINKLIRISETVHLMLTTKYTSQETARFGSLSRCQLTLKTKLQTTRFQALHGITSLWREASLQYTWKRTLWRPISKYQKYKCVQNPHSRLISLNFWLKSLKFRFMKRTSH